MFINQPIEVDSICLRVFTPHRPANIGTVHGVDIRSTSSLEEGRTKVEPLPTGLGEMMPLQLWETTLDPETRLLKQLVVEDAAEANVVFSSLMGSRVDVRKELIQNSASTINLEQLDI